MMAIRHWFNREYWLLEFVSLAFIVGLLLVVLGFGKIAGLVWAATAGLGTVPPVWRMIRDLMRGNVGVDILAVVAVLSALALGQYLAAVVITIMLTGGEALETYAQGRAKRELGALMSRAPKMARRLVGGVAEDVPVEKIAVGDDLLIRPGDIVPVDALITVGESSFDESAITGESLPVEHKVGEELVSGSVNGEALVSARAVRTSGDSQYQQIVNMVSSASTSRSPLVRLADRYSLPFTLLSFGIAGTAWAVSGQAVRGLEVLVVATPCPLLIATPVAIVSGMSREARHGIITKGGAALERLARLKTLAFDKTGTLTRGVPEVESYDLVDGLTEPRFLELAAAVAAQSNHILARGLVAAAAARGVTVPPAADMSEDAGEGMSGTVGGQRVMVGRADWLAARGVALPTLPTPDRTMAQLAVDGVYAGRALFADQVRPESAQVLGRLASLGVRQTMMLTGDHEPVARRIAGLLGMTDFRADLKPADKVAAIKAVPPRYRPVGMVGDGVNDAPTLAAADVGIALGARGSTAASESADVVIMLDSLDRLPLAISIARRALAVANQSIWIGIGLSIILMLIAATGRILPVYGALLQEAVDVAVILNALRARHG